MRRVLMIVLIGALGVLFAPSIASAHVERPSYWPDPRPDCHVAPCAGGAVPTARSLASALDESKPGRTRVVCQADSLTRLKASVRRALDHGYYVRPTAHRSLTAARAKALIDVNRRMFSRCGYHQIQAAVTASGNNDRVVVMPGIYTEPHSRKQPTNDPACARYLTKSDSGDPGALSHDYQLHCPNDANLVAVIGRGSDTGPVPDPPRTDRHGIPNAGRCIRCNLQLEGSGVSADDVIVEAGDASAGDGGPSAVGHKKDVGIFVDRADGFVLRNVTVRHAREHDIYILETDGYLFDRFKAYYAGGYGVLTFVEDNGVISNCDAAGNGDSGIYPGAGADTTDHRYLRFYPTYRYSQVVRYCDSHHNTGGFSGTNSHGTLVTHNNFYDNALGYTTDVFTAPGHPGFPQHGNVIEHNSFFDNNFNPFVAGSDVAPFIAAPVGTGLWLAGGNANVLRYNRFYDNWRRGVMLFAVPDATVCGPPPVGSSTPVPGCDPAATTTSYDNRFHHNTMGLGPRGGVLPNGLDFWWDSFPGNTGNCWWDNTAAPGRSVTTSPLLLPDCAGGTAPGTSIGTGDPVNESELVACLAGFTVSGYPAGNSTVCSWATTPEKPGSGSPLPLSDVTTGLQAEEFDAICAQGLAPRLCSPYDDWLATMFDSVVSTIAPAPVEVVDGVEAAASLGRLSSFTCSWWRQADDAHRLGMVQRIRNFATGPIDGLSDQGAPYGYGAGMSDARATQLFDDRCSMFQAGPFALYKIYGAAAPFAAAAG
ncbi:MAG TPA: right-handed parallel beta-helix repeat-containing protein [Nocardioides sp.]